MNRHFLVTYSAIIFLKEQMLEFSSFLTDLKRFFVRSFYLGCPRPFLYIRSCLDPFFSSYFFICLLSRQV